MTAFTTACPLSLRERVLAAARVLDGVLYVYGGNTLADGGLDCSGFIQYVYAKAGVEPWASTFPAKRDDTADSLWRTLAPLPDAQHAQPGDLAFYGDAKGAHHVMLVTRHEPGASTVEVMGASKGDSSCTDPVIAKAKGARVKTFPAHTYWSAFIGFRRMPGA